MIYLVILLLIGTFFYFYKSKNENVIWITDFNNEENSNMMLSIICSLHEYTIINLKGIIINNDTNLLKAKKIRKIINSYNIDSSKINISINGNFNISEINHNYDIDIWSANDMLDDILSKNKLTILCGGDISCLNLITNYDNILKLVLLGNYDDCCKSNYYDNKLLNYLYNKFKKTQFNFIDDKYCKYIYLNEYDEIYGSFIDYPLLLINYLYIKPFDSIKILKNKLLYWNNKY